jgi:hypothetical protein
MALSACIKNVLMAISSNNFSYWLGCGWTEAGSGFGIKAAGYMGLLISSHHISREGIF